MELLISTGNNATTEGATYLYDLIAKTRRKAGCLTSPLETVILDSLLLFHVDGRLVQ
jgi:hypothetical protein